MVDLYQVVHGVIAHTGDNLGGGEVVVADNTMTGEGVVLAQRLEQIAEPGGIVIQGAAYETVPKRLPFAYKSLGERELKGFNEPVRVYTVNLGVGVATREPEVQTETDVKADSWYLHNNRMPPGIFIEAGQADLLQFLGAFGLPCEN